MHLGRASESAQLEAYLPHALRLLRPALSRMASRWSLSEARQAVAALDVPLADMCLVYIDGVQRVLDAATMAIDG